MALDTGLGKTTLMCELGYKLARDSLSTQGRREVTVLLLVASAELKKIY